MNQIDGRLVPGELSMVPVTAAFYTRPSCEMAGNQKIEQWPRQRGALQAEFAVEFGGRSITAGQSNRPDAPLAETSICTA